jgi:hypothetical protein
MVYNARHFATWVNVEELFLFNYNFCNIYITLLSFVYYIFCHVSTTMVGNWQHSKSFNSRYCYIVQHQWCWNKHWNWLQLLLKLAICGQFLKAFSFHKAALRHLATTWGSWAPWIHKHFFLICFSNFLTLFRSLTLHVCSHWAQSLK